MNAEGEEAKVDALTDQQIQRQLSLDNEAEPIQSQAPEVNAEMIGEEAAVIAPVSELQVAEIQPLSLQSEVPRVQPQVPANPASPVQPNDLAALMDNHDSDRNSGTRRNSLARNSDFRLTSSEVIQPHSVMASVEAPQPEEEVPAEVLAEQPAINNDLLNLQEHSSGTWVVKTHVAQSEEEKEQQ